jgi:uncharacterized protein DUF3124
MFRQLTVICLDFAMFWAFFQTHFLRITMKKYSLFAYLIGMLTIHFLISVQLIAVEKKGLSIGQKIYVPVYSHIYIGNKEQPFLLTVTLSIRNTDPENQIKIILVDYYQSQGKLLKNYLNKPITLNPLGSLRYVIPNKDNTGGSGANFIVEWKSDKNVNSPIVESIMISTKSGQGVSFTSRGQVIFSKN